MKARQRPCYQYRLSTFGGLSTSFALRRLNRSALSRFSHDDKSCGKMTAIEGDFMNLMKFIRIFLTVPTVRFKFIAVIVSNLLDANNRAAVPDVSKRVIEFSGCFGVDGVKRLPGFDFAADGRLQLQPG